MKYGIDLFKIRPLSDSIDIASLEEKYNIKISPIYKIFATIFYLGEGKIFADKYFSTKFNRLIEVVSYAHINEEVGFSHFVPIEQAFETYASGGLGDFIYEKNLFPIGGANWDGLYVGIGIDNIDKIIVSDGTESIIVADNIFEFVRGIEVKKISAGTAHFQFDYSKLYKNWEEDFWRLRED